MFAYQNLNELNQNLNDFFLHFRLIQHYNITKTDEQIVHH